MTKQMAFNNKQRIHSFNSIVYFYNTNYTMTLLSLSASLSLFVIAVAVFSDRASAFAPTRAARLTLCLAATENDNDNSNDVLAAAIDAMYGDGSEMREEPAVTRARIQELVDNHSVLLFMKGSKFFPQCGFSDTATKILETFQVEYETVNVLEDDAIREGVKVFSQWPTIPQLYINGEFIGGSDIMMEMYESGELKKMMEEVKKD
jgi:monothiol glutaredoxin